MTKPVIPDPDDPLRLCVTCGALSVINKGALKPIDYYYGLCKLHLSRAGFYAPRDLKKRPRSDLTA